MKSESSDDEGSPEGEQKLQKVKTENEHKTEGEQKLKKVKTENEHKTEGARVLISNEDDDMPEVKDRELRDDSSKGQLGNRKEKF